MKHIHQMMEELAEEFQRQKMIKNMSRVSVPDEKGMVYTIRLSKHKPRRKK